MRIPLASPYTPLPRAGDRDPLDPFTGQLSPAQGAFATTPIRDDHLAR